MSHIHRFTSTDKAGNKIEFRVEIDENAIAAKLAPRLRKSKLGKVSAMDGAVKAVRETEPK